MPRIRLPYQSHVEPLASLKQAYADAFSSTAGCTAALTDHFGARDQTTATAAVSATLADVLRSLDAVTGTAIASATLADVLRSLDAVTGTAIASATLADVAASRDVITAATAATATLTDFQKLVDVVAGAGGAAALLHDRLSAHDKLDPGLQQPPFPVGTIPCGMASASLSDSLKCIDRFEATAAAAATLADIQAAWDVLLADVGAAGDMDVSEVAETEDLLIAVSTASGILYDDYKPGLAAWLYYQRLLGG